VDYCRSGRLPTFQPYFSKLQESSDHQNTSVLQSKEAIAPLENVNAPAKLYLEPQFISA